MPLRVGCLSRLSKSRLQFKLPYSSTSPVSPLFLPFLYPNSRRNASILSNLHDLPGAFRRKRRAGRGPSSGKGKTSGRGHKGQKQHGKVPAGFNGGQTPLEVVHGKRGFKNNFALDLTTLNLNKLTSWVAQNRIDPSYPITIRELRQSRCVSNVRDGVKLLAKGADDLPSTTPPLNIIVSRASAAAIAAVEARGGSVMTRYYTNFAIRQICKGRMDPIRSLQSEADGRVHELPKKDYVYRLPDPSRRKDIEYYRDPAHRGYLSHTVPEGQGPSLFFKTPGTAEQRAERAKVAKAQKGKTSRSAENRIW